MKNYYFSENAGLQNEHKIACPKNDLTTVFVPQNTDQPIKNGVSAPSTGNQPGFRLPRPMGRGVSVRNTNAFQVLQTVWVRSESTLLSSTILDVILSLYQQATFRILFVVKCVFVLSKFSTKIKIFTKNITFGKKSKSRQKFW